LTVTDTATNQSVAASPTHTRTNAGRLAVIAATLSGLLLINLVIYAIGRALGGDFTYSQDGAAVRVDPAAITIMSLAPLATGLALIAALSRIWTWAIRVARIAAPTLAVATIAVMTIPAGFDTTSTLALAAMHLATVPAALLALNALPRRQSQSTNPAPR
jgi:uncharacterized protein DUF6069